MGGLEIVDGRYAGLYERAVGVLARDGRVENVAIGGSVGAGTADAWSDLDLEIIVRADDHAAFLGEWPRWLDEITPTVFARTPIAPFVINAVTDEGLTLDLVVHKGEAFHFSPPADYAVGMLSSVRFAEISEALEYAVAEQLRGLAGPFISLVQREEHLRHLTGVPHLVGLVTTVFLAELDAPPPGKHWNQAFTPEQRAAVAALPPLSATRDGVVDFGLAVARLLVSRARPLFVELDLDWPRALAGVAAARLRECLDIDTTDWLH